MLPAGVDERIVDEFLVAELGEKCANRMRRSARFRARAHARRRQRRVRRNARVAVQPRHLLDQVFFGF